MKHLENMNKIMLVTGMMVSYGYVMEHFIAWYSGDPYEFAQFYFTRMQGPMRWVYRTMIFCNVVVPQIFWFKRWRTNIVVMWFASLLINVGMWCERYNIVVTSLHRDFLPSKWENYLPTWVDLSLFAGTIGLFSTLFLLFLKFVPAVAVTEVKELRHELAHDPTADPVGETH
jgi:molybdopterin-containing oxidoreductase family membrane subunit